MDQRAVILNVVCLFAVLFLFVSVSCFGRYMFLLRARTTGRISFRRYEMRRVQNRRVCNGLFWMVVAAVVIVGGAMELGSLPIFLTE